MRLAHQPQIHRATPVPGLVTRGHTKHARCNGQTAPHSHDHDNIRRSHGAATSRRHVTLNIVHLEQISWHATQRRATAHAQHGTHGERDDKRHVNDRGAEKRKRTEKEEEETVAQLFVYGVEGNLTANVSRPSGLIRLDTHQDKATDSSANMAALMTNGPPSSSDELGGWMTDALDTTMLSTH